MAEDERIDLLCQMHKVCGIGHNVFLQVLFFLICRIFGLFFHINFKPGNHTPLGMWRKGLFLQKNKKYLILLLSPEKFVILNMREHKLMKSAERRDTDASKRTGRDDIHKSKTVS
jgi:hypothetical protein